MFLAGAAVVQFCERVGLDKCVVVANDRGVSVKDVVVGCDVDVSLFLIVWSVIFRFVFGWCCW